MAQVVESLLLEAVFNVVPTNAYFCEIDGERFPVSRWAGHLNEIANALFASLILDEIRD